MVGFVPAVPVCGPVFQLRVYGLLCPCLEKSEHKSARQAITTIHTNCQRVLWHRSTAANSKTTRGSFLGGFSLFGSGGKGHTATNATGTASPNPGSASAAGNTNTTTCLAKITIQDSGKDGQPVLLVHTASAPQETREEQRAGGGDSSRGQCEVVTTTIKLRRVDKVALDGGAIVLTAKPVRPGQPGKELLRFSALQQQQQQKPLTQHDGIDDHANNNNLPATPDARNLLAHHWMVLTEWERQRRADQRIRDPDYVDEDDEDEDDDDEHATPNFFAARARQAAQMATRELELQQTKRARDARKAELLAQTGGLKYTALAMAANAQANGTVTTTTTTGTNRTTTTQQ